MDFTPEFYSSDQSISAISGGFSPASIASQAAR
jgi:hypothetical protein